MASSGPMRYTAASSAAPNPTSRSGWAAGSAGFSTASTSWRSPGAILDAQPAQEAKDVSRIFSSAVMTPLRWRLAGLGFDEGHERLGQRRARALAMGDQVERPRELEVAHLDAVDETGATFVL